jgi:2-methylcitrate dehydratase PrpD
MMEQTSVDVELASLGRYLLRRPPSSGYEAKFSLEFCVICALTNGSVETRHFTDAEVARLRPLVDLVHIQAGQRLAVARGLEVAVADREGRPMRRPKTTSDLLLWLSTPFSRGKH